MSAPHDVNMLRAKLRASLEKIGKSNGHAMPKSSSNIDPFMHEYFIATEGLAFFKQRAERALDALRDNVIGIEAIDAMEARVIDAGIGDEIVGGTGELYMATLNMSKASSRVDNTAVQNTLITEHGMTRQQVDALYERCSKPSAPAKRYKVLAR